MNNKQWNIIHVNPKDSVLSRSDGSRTIGVTDNKTKCVYIADNLSEALEDKVICHELCHVACFSYGINIPIETEEIIANFMSLYGREIISVADDIMGTIIYRMA